MRNIFGQAFGLWLARKFIYLIIYTLHDVVEIVVDVFISPPHQFHFKTLLAWVIRRLHIFSVAQAQTVPLVKGDSFP